MHAGPTRMADLPPREESRKGPAGVLTAGLAACLGGAVQGRYVGCVFSIPAPPGSCRTGVVPSPLPEEQVCARGSVLRARPHLRCCFGSLGINPAGPGLPYPSNAL